MSLLDPQAIKTLRDLQEKTGRDLLQNLVQLYKESTPEIITSMTDLLMGKNYEDLARQAHSLKSSSANLGASQMAELCKFVEYSIEGDDDFSDEELKQKIQEIKSLYPKLLEELNQLS